MCLFQGFWIYRNQKLRMDYVCLRLIQANIRMVLMDNRHLDSNSSFLVCSSLHLGFLGCCFSWDGVLESEWGLFTPPLLSAVPLSWDGGAFLLGFSAVQVPSCIFLSMTSFFLCAPESPLACSPIVEMPAASFSSSEAAVEGFDSKTSSWDFCFNKSAVVLAPCLGSFSNVFVLFPWVREKQKVRTGRAPYVSVRLHTRGCHQVSQRLR